MKSIAVIFGGQSTEHDVSIISALASVIKPLELSKQYQVEAIYITKDGKWYWDNKLKNIELFSSGKVQDLLDRLQPVELQLDGGLTLCKSSKVPGRKKHLSIDVVFPVMHGTYGEDGSLMGMLRMLNRPFIGCDLDASVIAMDKVLAKQIAQTNNIPVTKYQHLSSEEFIGNPNKVIDYIEKSLSYPLFVKPAHLGSSIGINRATDQQALRNAIEVALHYDEKVLIEEEVNNLIEVTLPIMGNGNQLTAGLLERPLTEATDFFDFDTKYLKGGKKGGGKSSAQGAQGYSEIPAKIDKSLYTKAEDVAKQAYRAIGCAGIARVDLLIDGKTKQVYFNEVNPMPGSLYSHNWQAAGISNVQLVQALVKLAEERWNHQHKKTTTFNTNYLKQF